jgi:hypothetical protein
VTIQQSNFEIAGFRLFNADCVAMLVDPEPWEADGMNYIHVITDPPYEDRFHAAMASGKRPLRTDGGPEGGALDFDGIDAIRPAFMAAVNRTVPGWFIAFCTPEGVAPWADAINASDMKYKRACIWVKPDAKPQMNGQGPAAGYESFVTAWGGRGFSSWNAGGKRGVYTHLVNAPDRDGRHKTEKPRRLMAEIIEDFTNPGDTILDPFMGSGTTGVAALQLGRRFIGIEKDPRWYAVAVERIAEASRQALLFPEEPTQPRDRKAQGEMI